MRFKDVSYFYTCKKNPYPKQTFSAERLKCFSSARAKKQRFRYFLDKSTFDHVYPQLLFWQSVVGKDSFHHFSIFVAKQVQRMLEVPGAEFIILRLHLILKLFNLTKPNLT